MSLKVFLTSFQSIFAQLGNSSTASPPILSKATPSFNWWVGCHHSEALPNHWLSTEPPKEAHFLDFPKHHQRVKAEEVHQPSLLSAIATLCSVNCATYLSQTCGLGYAAD